MKKKRYQSIHQCLLALASLIFFIRPNIDNLNIYIVIYYYNQNKNDDTFRDAINYNNQHNKAK